MALRLRRGTDAQRQLITPAQGELIYVTDTTELYVGDGTTLGGVRITGEVVNQLSQLNDVDAALPQDGDVLSYDSATGDWVAGELPLGDLSNVDLVTVAPTDGSVLSYDATAGGWVPASSLGLDASLEGLSDTGVSLASNGDALVYNSVSGFWEAQKIRVSSLFDVELDSNLSNGQVLTYDIVQGNWIAADVSIGGTFSGDVTGSVYADDSTLLVDGLAGIIPAENLVGSAVIDITGSVFSDDSGLLVDAVNSLITGKVVNIAVETDRLQAGSINVGGDTPNLIITTDDSSTLVLNTTNETGEIVSGKRLRVGGRSSGFDDQGFLDIYNENENTNAISVFHNSESANSVTATIAKSRGTKLAPTVVTSGDTLGAFQAQGYNGTAYRNAGGMAVVANGTPGAAYIPAKVSLYTAASNGIPTSQFSVDSNGTGTFTGAAQLAVYADNTARDAAITSPTAGMLVFNTTNTKFQGYTGSAWVDLN
jgi:hypothetical protein